MADLPDPHHEKQAKLCAAAFQVLLGDESYLDLLQDYIWAICEETNWVLPAYENREVALRSLGIGFSLAEISVGLRHVLADEIVARIGSVIERRIFEPYLERHDQLSWWKGGNNRNGVCNSGVGAMFLLLGADVARTARAGAGSGGAGGGVTRECQAGAAEATEVHRVQPGHGAGDACAGEGADAMRLS